MLNALFAAPVAAPAPTAPTQPPEPGAGDGSFARLLDQARPAPPRADAAESPESPEAPEGAGAPPADAAKAPNPASKAARGLPRAAHAVTKAVAAPSDTQAAPPGGDTALAEAAPGEAASASTPHPAADGQPAADPAALLAMLPALPPVRPATATLPPVGPEDRAGAADLASRALAGARSAARPAEPGPAASAAIAGAATEKPGAARGTVESIAAAAPRVTDLTPERTDPLPAALPPAAAAASGPQPPTSAEAAVATPPGRPGFAEELGARLSTFVRNGIEHARLELNPQDMGPVTVRIEIDGANAQVSLAAEQVQTRTALEQALPTLAGSLREAGLTLSGGGVFDQPRQPQADRQGDGTATGRRAARSEGLPALDATATGAALPPRRRGVVDLVA